MASKRNIFEEVGSDTKITSAPAGAIARSASGDRHWVRLWLWSLVSLIIVMITVGGLTRLTDSGLSITEWKPVTGALPPLTDQDWQEAFDKYRQIPEYQLINKGMSLSEFKFIFFWEWAHRLLGRVIGLAFALPLFWFALRRAIPQGYGLRLVALLALGGAALKVVLAVAAAAEVLGVVQARVKGFDPNRHRIRSARPGPGAVAKLRAGRALAWSLRRGRRAGPGDRPG